jgi:hypothetical protein
MQETFVALVAEAPCPSCGEALERTTVLCRDPECAAEIMVERPGLWCRDCGCVALDQADQPSLAHQVPARAAA